MRKIKVRLAKTIKRILERPPQGECEVRDYNKLKSIYNNRILGVCIYRLKAEWDFKNLILPVVMGSFNLTVKLLGYATLLVITCCLIFGFEFSLVINFREGIDNLIKILSCL